jgi:hypothetical protein
MALARKMASVDAGVDTKPLQCIVPSPTSTNESGTPGKFGSRAGVPAVDPFGVWQCP